MKQQKIQSLLKSRPVLLACSLVFSLFLAEYILGPVLLMPRSLFLLQYVGEPNSQVDGTPINSQGYTGHILSQIKPTPSTIRILTLGGSAFFNRRMTERITESLSSLTSRNLEIQGGALQMHDTRSSVIKYKRHFHKYNFNYVLIYHGINDLWMNHVAMEDFKKDYTHRNANSKRNAILDHSIIARILYNEFVWSPAKYVHNGALFSSSQVFEQNIRELVKLIRRDKGIPILMTFSWHIPADYTGKRFNSKALGYNNPDSYTMCPVDVWGSVDYVRRGLTLHNSIIKKIANEEQVLLIDQQSRLGDNIYYFGDVCHLSEEGTDFLIKNIAEFFLTENLFSLTEPGKANANKSLEQSR